MERESIILIPTLNEKKNLEKLIPAIFDLMPEISVLVADDNSQDGTEEYLGSIKNLYPNLFIINRKNNFGYGRACIEGFQLIRKDVRHPMSYSMTSDVVREDFEYIVTMDADFSHDYRVIPGMLKQLAEHDVVIGSRYISGGKIENWKFHRKVLSKVANFYVRAILNLKIQDLTTGFNAYRQESLFKINLNNIQSDGYAFLVELKYKLANADVNITEYPITFSERREGQSKMSGKIIWESFKLAWQLKFKKI